MIESPAYADLENEVIRRTIFNALQKRFGSVSEEARKLLKPIEDLETLQTILGFVYEARDLSNFDELLAQVASE